MAVKFRDYYATLGVGRSASADEIKAAFRRLARKCHPDVNPGDRRSEERFKEINEAYEVLSDPKKRELYDRLGPNWKAGSDFTPPPGWENIRIDFGESGSGFGSGSFGPGLGTGGFSEFFESLFGDLRGKARPTASRSGKGWSARGEDIEIEAALALEEAHRGVTRRIVLHDGRSLEVKIPAGVREGSVIRLAGQGESGANGRNNGDLYIRVRLGKHPVFTVNNDDITVQVPITPWEAVLGAKIQVPTLEGAAEMTVPAGAQSGQRLRLRGLGLNRRRGGRGDQFVQLSIAVPTQPTPSERALFEQLARESSFCPRVPTRK